MSPDAQAALPPAFFPVGLNLVGRRCVVIGPSDDREAVEKAEALREAGADLAWYTDAARVGEAELRGAFFVISTPQDAALSGRLRGLAETHRFLLCCIDQPRFGFVAMAAVVKAGPARIAISTGGVAPRIGRRLREALQSALDGTFADFLDCLAVQRRRTRARFPHDAHARRAAMIEAAEGFEPSVHLRYPAWFRNRQRRMRPRLDAEELRDG